MSNYTPPLPPLPLPSGVLSGILPQSNHYWVSKPAMPPTPDYRDIGQKVLAHIDSLDTARIGELVHAMQESLRILKINIALTNEQWKHWSLVTSSFEELLE